MNTRTIDCRKALLKSLERVEPYALPEESLFESLNATIRPPCGQAEFEEHIDWLKSRGMAAVMPGAMGDEKVRWLITEQGKAELRR